MRGLLLLLMVSLLAACPKPPAPVQQSGADMDFGNEVDNGFAELIKSLESTVLENYTQLTFHNIEAIIDSVASEREVQFLGVTPNDIVFGVEPKELAIDRRIFPHYSPRVLSKNLDVHLSQDGSVAWVFDEISYRVQYMNREASIPIRLTAIYVRDGERWVLVGENRSLGVRTDELFSMVKTGKLRQGKSIKNDYGGDKKLAVKLLGIVGRFINSGEGLHQNENSLVVFHPPGTELKAPFTTDSIRLAQYFGENATVALREFRVQVSISGKVAWLVANLSVTAEVDGKRESLPMRASFVLEKLKEQGWGIVQVHVAVPLQERQISTRIFGPNY